MLASASHYYSRLFWSTVTHRDAAATCREAAVAFLESRRGQFSRRMAGWMERVAGAKSADTLGGAPAEGLQPVALEWSDLSAQVHSQYGVAC